MKNMLKDIFYRVFFEFSARIWLCMTIVLIVI